VAVLIGGLPQQRCARYLNAPALHQFLTSVFHISPLNVISCGRPLVIANSGTTTFRLLGNVICAARISKFRIYLVDINICAPGGKITEIPDSA
jgi:hypothetical protein